MYYIGGDFNADLLKSNSDISIKDFMNLTYSLGCIPLITHPTRITTTSSTLLDHVYTNNVVGEHKSFILVEDVSDHLPVMVCSNLSLPKSEKSTVTLIRDTKNFEVEKFLDKLTEGMELLGDIKEECIDNYTEKFIDIFHKTLNIHAPLRKQSRKETKLKNKPWLSKGILISIQQKNLLYKRALKLNDSSTWAQYKVYRNKLTHIKEYAKRLYIKNLVNDNKHDTSSLWKIINKIIHLKNVKKNNIPNKMYASKSESAQGPQAISNLFNKYFIEIGVNLASTIKTPAIIDGKFNATSLIQSSCNSFVLEPIVEEEAVNYIRAMNPSKSTGRHGIPAKYIKMSGSVIAPVLTNIFNACISTGYFPKVLKIAEVVPIFKKGERELCSNYCPISILNPFAKLFEKCLLDQLNNYFVSNNLISPNQYGFKKNCSTNEAVLDIYNKLLDNMDKKLITCSIFLDLRKAYDTIDHTILIKKVEKYGIIGLPLQLLASYLTDRQQYTIVNQYKSKSRDVICGIPQGSTLGPLLFNIYINDLPLASNSTIHLFADDTNLTLSHSNVSTLQQNINDELVNVSNWFKVNKLSINFNKTEFMVVTTKQNKPELKVSIDNNPIKQSHHIKYLGVFIDDNLNWKQQIKEQCSKVARGSWALNQLKHFVDEQTLRSVYHCLIYSHLQHCISSWGTASKSTLAPLFILQKRSIRLLTGSGYREYTNPLFYRAKCLKLKDIYSLETAKLMYKIHNNVLSFANTDKFNLIKNCYTHKTRFSHKNNFFLPRTRTRLGQKSLSFAGIKIWNEIPSSMKEVSFYRFKKAVKAHFLSNYETDKS